MKQFLTVALCAILSLIIAAPLAAGDKEKKDDAAKTEKKADKKPREKKADGKKEGKRGHSLSASILKRVKEAGADEKQLAQIESLCKEYEGKISAAREKAQLTKEQREARTAAIKQAKADGKDRKEAAAAVAAASKLTSEQQAAMDQAKSLFGELRTKVAAVLTEDQREKAGLAAKKDRKPKGERKPKTERKPKAEKPADKGQAS